LVPPELRSFYLSAMRDTSAAIAPLVSTQAVTQAVTQAEEDSEEESEEPHAPLGP
jgi:hypothetical protein